MSEFAGVEEGDVFGEEGFEVDLGFEVVGGMLWMDDVSGYSD